MSSPSQPLDAPPAGPGRGPPTRRDGAATRAADLAELERRIRAIDPAVFLVEPRVLRRVARQDSRVGIFGALGANLRCHVIRRERAMPYLSLDELGLAEDSALPPLLALLARPEPAELAHTPSHEVYAAYERLLFSARVQRTLRQRRADGQLEIATVRARIDELGHAAFDEARAVLRHEHLLRDRRDLFEAYVAFAALYLELRHFAPEQVPDFFPSLGDPVRIDAVLARDLDVAALRVPMRLMDGAATTGAAAVAEPAGSEAGPPPGPPRPVHGARTPHLAWLRKAERAAARGNDVRAAICYTRAAAWAPQSRRGLTRAAARRDIERLCGRLRAALGWDAETENAWARMLPSLLERAAWGFWTPEARLLYDLQKVAIEHEKGVYAVDVIGWVASLGRRPLRRPLPHHGRVLTVQHLQSAERRLSRVRIAPEVGRRLAERLRHAIEHAELELRRGFRPIIERTLAQTGWQPRNVPEEVARDKLIEELLDHVQERGFLRMGDLRDSVSRGNLKLEDLSGVVELVRGDRLLATDRRLAAELEGVYHRGEVYLRGLQRVNAVAFGTRVGRLLTRFVLLPGAASFAILEGLDHLINPLLKLFQREPVHLVGTGSFLILAALLLGLINHAGFRNACWLSLRGLGKALWWLASELPARVRALPPVRRIVESRAFATLTSWVFKPALFGFGTLLVLMPLRIPRIDVYLGTGLAYVLSALLLNSRRGRDLEEILADRVGRLGQRIWRDVLPGVFRLVMDFFDRLLEAIERIIYTVDEWLRFRAGQGGVRLAISAALGLVWRAITYVVRFGVNLVIEPQVNPIKHFPVVTVSHKLMFPLILALRGVLLHKLGWSQVHADVVSFLLQFILPGMVGFLVWELKENWKLYRANRSPVLRPVIVGHHGETVARFLRPGVHSGTVPKLFAKLRRSETKAALPGRPDPGRKHRAALHHVEHDLRRFIERELLGLLERSTSLGGGRIALVEVALGSNRIRLGLADRHRAGAAPLRVVFEEQSGWLVAGVADLGWVAEATDSERATLRDALAGCYKLAAVDLVREQIEATLQGAGLAYDIAEEGLILWTPDYRHERVWDLWDQVWAGGEGGPTDGPNAAAGTVWPDLSQARLRFDRQPLPWRRWVELWERDRGGMGHPEPALVGIAILP